MKISSPNFVEGQAIPPWFTCDGENVNPELRLSAVPERAQSLALVVDDPDASAGTWVHWLLWNIAPDTGVIRSGEVPLGAVEGVTSAGKAGYGGPCPPSGVHRYFFKIYALDTPLNLPATATASDLIEAMTGHILEEAHLIGVYSR